MKHQMRILQGLKLAAVLAVALSMGACANKNPLGADGAMASAATPGSQQDFVVNVGDRVFFESDQTELIAAGDRDPGKAGAVAAELQPLRLHHRRPCRRARHPRIQHRARRAARPVGAQLSSPRAASMPNRMRTISYGKERPVAVCNDISCWSQNRRAVTVLNASS